MTMVRPLNIIKQWKCISITTLVCFWQAVTVILYNPVNCGLQRIRLPVWHLSIAPCLTPGWPQAVLTVGSAGSCRLWRSTTRWGLVATQPQALWGERRGVFSQAEMSKVYTTNKTYECSFSPSHSIPRSASNVEGRSVPATPLLSRTAPISVHVR